jgi:hypothetical protein
MKRRPATSAAAPAGPNRAEVDGFRAKHLALAERVIMTAEGLARVTVDDGDRWRGWPGARAATAAA